VATVAAEDLLLTRVLRAPRERVFEAWTDAGHFARWFGPDAAIVIECELDARPGGVIRFCHEFADGMKLWVRGRFDEVVASERIVFTVGFVDAEGRPGRHPLIPDWPLEARLTTTVLLDGTGEETRITVRQHVSPAAAASSDAVARERRAARDGWLEVLARLNDQLTTTAKEQ
jgi:uncharacterized protein YndB with AHSA1/START domain